MKRIHALFVAASAMAALAIPVGVSADRQLGPPPSRDLSVSTLADGIAGAGGTTIGPDGALYVASTAGEIIRVDVNTGAASVWASGLPPAVAPIGGPTDIVFHSGKAYVLVSLVGGFFGNNDVNGVYRIDDRSATSHPVVADLGQWALDNPPPDDLDFFIPTGVHYAIESHLGGLVVTDGHHNRLISVSTNGDIGLLKQFPNVVPTGIDTRGNTVLLALAGPAPHLPEWGQLWTVNGHDAATAEAASGAPLLVDVERGRGNLVFGLAQGDFPEGAPDGSPAIPGTGELMVVDGDTFVPVVAELNQPTSMEIVGNTALVVGLDGVVTRINGLPGPASG